MFFVSFAYLLHSSSSASGGSAKTKEKEKEKAEKAVRRQFDVAELRCRLKVQILEARNLVAADSNGTFSSCSFFSYNHRFKFAGKSSPFVKIKCGVGKAKTPYQSKTLNPEVCRIAYVLPRQLTPLSLVQWNNSFWFGISDLEKEKLYLTVMSHEKISEHRILV